MQRNIFDDHHNEFRDSFRRFVAAEITPHYEKWESDGIVPRELFTKAGELGFLCMDAPEQFGGGGVADFRFNAIITEELMYAGHNGAVLCFSTHNDVCLPYLLELCNEEQNKRWLPDVCAGNKVMAIALTEPHAGSDLAGIKTTAVRDGDHYIVNGSKTFITNGINGDLFVTAVKTDPAAGARGVSILIMEGDAPGFERGRNLSKMGLHCQDTAELFFNDVRVPVANLLGEENKGFNYLMHNLAQERLGIAMAGTAAARAALNWTIDYTKERTAFGQRIADFQNTKFVLAELDTEVEIGEVYIDRCISELVNGTLTPEESAKAKWWATELQKRTVDRCVQLFGGYGYMLEYPVARAYLDARITTIYGGTTEIMKEIIGRSVTR